MPRDAVIREIKEEVNLSVTPINIIHEDSNYDRQKDMIFIRLVDTCELISKLSDIKLDKLEHSEYKLIESLSDLNGEKISPFLYQLFEEDLKNIK